LGGEKTKPGTKLSKGGIKGSISRNPRRIPIDGEKENKELSNIYFEVFGKNQSTRRWGDLEGKTDLTVGVRGGEDGKSECSDDLANKKKLGAPPRKEGRRS